MAVLCLLAVSCRRRDFRTVVIHVPEMKNEACSQYVTKVVRSKTGGPVDEDHVEVNLTDRTVVVTYNSLKHSVKNIEHAIAESGFTANNIPADQAAREQLPQACR